MSAAPPRTYTGIPPTGKGLIIVARPLNIRNAACTCEMLSGTGEAVNISRSPDRRSRIPIGSILTGNMFFLWVLFYPGIFLFEFDYFIGCVSDCC